MISKKPLIKLLNQNPKLKTGKSLTWLSVEIIGYGLIRFYSPAISDWKPILLWVKGYKSKTIAVPINTTLVISSWYFFGMNKDVFNVTDSNWIIETPKSYLNTEELKLPTLRSKFKKMNRFNFYVPSGIFAKHAIKNDLIGFISNQEMISSKLLIRKFKLDFLYNQKILNITKFYKRGGK